MRMGIGFDAHRLAEGRDLILGGHRLEHNRGLEGHSDGDVLLHALTDAILGAVAAPDIGALFPSEDPRWRGVQSSVFLRRALEIAKQTGYEVSSVDAVIIAQEPRLSEHIAPIRQAVARLVGIPESAVGLKAKTTDGMGFIGRGEGVAVHAVATLVRLERTV
ncbi:MAG TPA: 2-C-methyl-D-erythritol 2,4-cyclodiphosphate synthase [Vicinamibacteria bacterium]|nr:2-C-methyl-D-erythritol 2,4-cyclodiphosphate synthase [Vicinamibacteria bacterium]